MSRPIHIDHSDGTTHDCGELSEKQADILCPFVIGRHVHDLGSGRGILAAHMIALGASRITGVDQVYPRTIESGRLRFVGSYFHEYTPREPLEVAFVSWPPYMLLAIPEPRILQALPDLCSQAPVVAYLGSNFGAVCGNLELWRHLGTREVLAHVPDPRNTLIVYGRKGARIPGQGLLPEEKAALYRAAVPQPVYGVTYE